VPAIQQQVVRYVLDLAISDGREIGPLVVRLLKIAVGGQRALRGW
jgi:hypothetical protein